MMKAEKKVIAQIPKSYAIGSMIIDQKNYFLAAAEKAGPCYLFDPAGNIVDTVWETPGGVMTMVQVPGREDQFLATQKFFSPNDSIDARIVIATRVRTGEWEIRSLCGAPHVHRFGILNRGGVNYLLVCTLKSGHEYKNDWRFPGACYGAILPDDLSSFNEKNPLPLHLIKDGMLRNHGFAMVRSGGHDAAVVGCEQGTFLFNPPPVAGADWNVVQLSSVPSSDSVFMDFDGDGLKELGVISAFHGASLTIYHQDEFGNYVPQWKYAEPEKNTKFIHATWADQILGKPTWIVGWRDGTKDTIAITWDPEAGTYRTDFIDRNAGCANVMHYVDQEGQDILIATNREIDEVAMYTLTEA